MADTLERMKPKAEKLSGEEKEKYIGRMAKAMMPMVTDPKVQEMVQKIQSGSNADKWKAIEARMRQR